CLYPPDLPSLISSNAESQTHFLLLNPDLQYMPGAAGRRGTVMNAVMNAVTKLVTNPWWQCAD
ncbi:hypothetical protein, partial [Corynebacterium amycolatum]|uniref:hypothetical protein n=1 Tax=Corynebacterium amycolatum TaxID=43765 RepID=UPI0025515A51